MGSSKIVNGDSADELKKLEDDSVDLLCTDPPYGYSFMGKSWDKMLPPKEIFEESLRVLKPGSFAFVMSAPRSDVQSRMIQMLEDVGFEVGFTPIYWTYATGFPKAMNIGKAVDKRLGAKREVIGIKKRGDVEEAKKRGTTFTQAEANRNNKDIFGYGEEEITSGPASDEAKKLDGSYGGYQPKPAVEVVIVAMKPLDQKGYLDQALHNGKGVTWLDDCRIPFAGTSDEEQYESDKKGFTERSSIKEGSVYADEYGGTYNYGFKKPKKTKRKPREEGTVFKTSGFKSENNDTAEASPFGRFAANLLVSDDVLNVKSKGQLAPTTGKEPSNYKENNTHGSYLGYRKEMKPRDDGDSFSRYYDLDAWWEDRVQKLPDEVKNTFPFLVVPKPSKSEKNMGLDNFDKQQKIFNGQSDKPSTDMKGVEQKFTTQPSANNHPTVKPTTLMSYLVTLGSRKGDVVLDPFAGSGTTGISCVFSERNYLLIEREKEYFDILKARIKKAENPAGIVQHEWF